MTSRTYQQGYADGYGKGQADQKAADAAAVVGQPTNGAPRLWSADSAWNLPIPDGVPTDPSSAAQWGWAKANVWDAGRDFIALSGIDPYYGGYGVARYVAEADTPSAWVAPSTSWWAGMYAPIPATADPSRSGDHHLSVEGLDGILREFWHLARDAAGTWSAGAGAAFDRAGLGYCTPQTPMPQGQTSPRAYGGPATGGLYTYEDALCGRALHSLAVAVPNQRGRKYAQGFAAGNPKWHVASAFGNGNAADDRDDYFPVGACIQLQMSDAEIAATGWPAVVQGIAWTLAHYGAYVVDGSGTFSVFCETLQGHVRTWRRLLGSTAALVLPHDPARWRTLQMPSLLP